MHRRFECKTGGHNKFWTIEYPAFPGGSFPAHDVVTCQFSWGKIGGTIQRKTKSVRGSDLAKLIDEKRSKGYIEVTGNIHPKPLTIKNDLKKMSKLLGNDHSII